ncbi:hypothetical protein NPIL_346251 [Nephila pilipes]|uniref:Uncharacterized protein n=1 Tax=Nephila pilipes TaxID=299642 RepID=A0A8X6UJ90_NEPPI|nr:hypothetical protein NPIL_346251 [Nephila pilipes]
MLPFAESPGSEPFIGKSVAYLEPCSTEPMEEAKYSKRYHPDDDKRSRRLAPRDPGHEIPGLMPKIPTYAIPEPEWHVLVYQLMVNFSFLRVGKDPVPKFFITTKGWLYFVAAMMGTHLPTVSCRMHQIIGVQRLSSNVFITTTLAWYVAPMADPRQNFGPIETPYQPSEP